MTRIELLWYHNLIKSRICRIQVGSSRLRQWRKCDGLLNVYTLFWLARYPLKHKKLWFHLDKLFQQFRNEDKPNQNICHQDLKLVKAVKFRAKLSQLLTTQKKRLDELYFYFRLHKWSQLHFVLLCDSLKTQMTPYVGVGVGNEYQLLFLGLRIFRIE